MSIKYFLFLANQRRSYASLSIHRSLRSGTFVAPDQDKIKFKLIDKSVINAVIITVSMDNRISSDDYAE